MVEDDCVLLKNKDTAHCFVDTVGASLRVALSFSLGFSFSAWSYAELYTWTDESGRTHYSDVKPRDMKGVLIEGTNSSQLAITENSGMADGTIKDEEKALSEAEAYQVRQKRLLDVLKEERDLQKQGKFQQEQEMRSLAKYCSQLKGQISESSDNGARHTQSEGGKIGLTDQEREAHDVRLKELYQQNCEKFNETPNE